MEFVGEEVFGPRNPFLLGAGVGGKGVDQSRWQVQPERSRMAQCWALVSACSQHTVMLWGLQQLARRCLGTRSWPAKLQAHDPVVFFSVTLPQMSILGWGD